MHGREVHALFWWENLKEKDCLELYGEVNSVKNTTINIWLNDGVY